MDPPAPDKRSRREAGGGSGGIERQLRHRTLAARTVAVSFRAAMDSARRHLNVPDAQRDEIKERWRAWALETLTGYQRELDEFVAREPITGDGALAELRRCRDELERGLQVVTTTEGD